MSFRSALIASLSLPYKRRLNYLTSSGTQYIDLGVVPTTDTRLEVKARCNAASGTVFVFGSRTSYNTADQFAAAFYVNQTEKFFWGFGTSYSVDRAAFADEWATISLSSSGAVVNGTTRWTPTASTVVSVLPMYLFACNATGISRLIGDVAYCKVYRGSALVQDLIPVIDLNDQAKMYDQVSKSYPTHYGTFEYA